MRYASGVGPFATLAAVVREVSVLAAATPTNAAEERARLCAAFGAGREAVPRWVYCAYDIRDQRRRIVQACAQLVRRGDPLLTLVLARADELLVECDAIDAVGGVNIGRAADARFGRAASSVRQAALALAKAGVERVPAARSARLERTDAATHTSLLGRMRTEVARLHLPFDVRTNARLCALAATGERTVWIASARSIAARCARRTVAHEVCGHALPRARAREMPHAIFVLGTAGGAEDQEGLALEAERHVGLFDAERKFELGVRHLAVALMRSGGTFVDVVRALGALGAETPLAVLCAERAFRGSDGRSPGLGRERVYLEAHVRVRAHLARTPGDEALLGSGQVAVGALRDLKRAGFGAKGRVGSRRPSR